MNATTIISRKEAKAEGLTRYFTGKACPQGHVAERAAHNGQCIECKSAAKKEWVKQNPDKVRKQKSASYERHSGRILEVMRDQYAANPEPKKARANAWRVANPDLHLAKNNAWRAANRDKDHAWSKQWREKNIEKVRQKNRDWRKANPDKHVAKEQNRRARKRQAIPSWFGEFDEFVIQEAAHLAKLREVAYGFPWHVDHMIPLQSRTACGLHCAENIAVIPDVMNYEKGNRMIYTTTGSWLR